MQGDGELHILLLVKCIKEKKNIRGRAKETQGEELIIFGICFLKYFDFEFFFCKENMFDNITWCFQKTLFLLLFNYFHFLEKIYINIE